MKIELKNTSHYSPEAVRLCIDYALRSVLDIRGKLDTMPVVKVTVKKTGRTYSGCAWRNSNRMVLRIGQPTAFPCAAHTYRGYKPDNMPVADECNDAYECLTALAAHELMHLHNMTGTKQQYEFRAELAWSDAVTFLRKRRAEFDAELDAIRHKEASKITAAAQREQGRAALLASPQFKLGKLLDARKTWTRKAKLAATKIKKLERKIRALEKAIKATGNN